MPRESTKLGGHTLRIHWKTGFFRNPVTRVGFGPECELRVLFQPDPTARTRVGLSRNSAGLACARVLVAKFGVESQVLSGSLGKEAFGLFPQILYLWVILGCRRTIPRARYDVRKIFGHPRFGYRIPFRKGIDSLYLFCLSNGGEGRGYTPPS